MVEMNRQLSQFKIHVEKYDNSFMLGKTPETVVSLRVPDLVHRCLKKDFLYGKRKFLYENSIVDRKIEIDPHHSEVGLEGLPKLFRSISFTVRSKNIKVNAGFILSLFDMDKLWKVNPKAVYDKVDHPEYESSFMKELKRI